MSDADVRGTKWQDAVDDHALRRLEPNERTKRSTQT